jgi:hypothetical protein
VTLVANFSGSASILAGVFEVGERKEPARMPALPVE